jgi:1-deoxyxylulose-5-phosphate synthase
MQKAEVSAPIIGVTKPQHLEDAVAALELTLEREEIERLERDYVPHAVAGAL